MTLDDLVAEAGLPGVQRVRSLTDGPGLDNHLSLVTLTDGRRLLSRKPVQGEPRDQTIRAAFLAQHRVGAPQIYATAADGTSLVEWIPGTPLADFLTAPDNDTATTERVWRHVGAALAAVHAVTFPAPLQGPVGPYELTLRPSDPVGELHQSVQQGRRWIHEARPRLADVPDLLHQLIDQYADDIRAEQPCLLHGDVNLANFIVTDEAVRPIDWDHPRVGYPLAELGALDEHAYLNGSPDGLSPAFWLGYGRTVPGYLLLLYRAVGCIGWLAGTDWAEWDAATGFSTQTKSKLRHWRELLARWADTLPRRLGDWRLDPSPRTQLRRHPPGQQGETDDQRAD